MFKRQDYMRSRACIAQLLRSDATFGEAMHSLTTFCDATLNRHLDFDAVANEARSDPEICEWIARLSASEVPAAPHWPIRSWLFGLFETVDEAYEEECGIQATGHAWAEWEDGERDERAFLPADREVKPQGLVRLYKHVHAISDHADSNFLEYALCLGYVAFALRATMRLTSIEMLQSGYVFVCWSGGDYLQIHPLDPKQG